jgi:hypothetical protein
MSNLTRAMMMGAAGASGDKVYVDDVFSTFLYDGTGSAQTITNGIDLAGEGGLVWLKSRTSAGAQLVFDTERGRKYLRSDQTSAQYDLTSSPTYSLTSFNNNGFSLGLNFNNGNPPGEDMVSWSFRKAPGFFDVVTYTGDGVAGRTVSHNLGSVPGVMIVKSTSNTSDWYVYHASEGPTKYLRLNTTDFASTGAGPWSNTAPTASEFTVQSVTNYSGQDYVAYIFAHDDASFGTGGNESIIKCGSYTGSASAVPVNLGWEPQWLLVKKASGVTSPFTNWAIFDNMRGVTTGGSDVMLAANLTTEEGGANMYPSTNLVDFNSTGFTIDPIASQYSVVNTSGETFIYIAIRRPNKPPEAATEVFAVNLVPSDSTYVTTGFPVDFGWQKTTGDTWDNFSFSRLQGSGRTLRINSADAEINFGPGPDFDSNTQMQGTRGIGALQQILFGFKRAPGFFDVVAYTGTGVARTVNHNLGVAPELTIVKTRSDASAWVLYSAQLSANQYMEFDRNFAALTGSPGPWNNTRPTNSVFSLNAGNDVNVSSRTYIALLFATLPGISKVSSYTGTGNAINVDCGFTNGARFVLIKRTDSTGDWYFWDTARGIVSGNDPYLLLNSTAAEVTTTDYIDPLNAGFTVTSTAPAALNASGGTYIFLAIA